MMPRLCYSNLLPSAALLLLAGVTFAENDFDDYISTPQRCDANPICADLKLADDCCPTNLAGIFLDCCENPGASCAANAGCAGLADDCCPTKDGQFLFCCFENDPDLSKYKYDLTFASRARGGNVGQHWVSTGSYSNIGTVNGRFTYSNYTRNKNQLYDIIYTKVDGGISDVGAYITGHKKFTITIVSTTAPPCTQVMLQLDHIPVATSDNYPVGRHSRYLGTIAETAGNGGNVRYEFDFLDRPDESVADADVNAIALLFDPGQRTGDYYVYHNLDSYSVCNAGDDDTACQASPVKSCPATYVIDASGVASVNDNNNNNDNSDNDSNNNNNNNNSDNSNNIDNSVNNNDSTNNNNGGGQQQQQQQGDLTGNSTDGGGSQQNVIVAVTPDCSSDCANPACMNVGDACAVVTSYEALAPNPNFGASSTSGSMQYFSAVMMTAIVAGMGFFI